MTQEQINQILMDIPVFGKRRTPVSASDFGDTLTIGLHLKKIHQSDSDTEFGRYLGKLGTGKWGVGLKDFVNWNIIDILEYSTLEDLKEVWQLD